MNWILGLERFAQRLGWRYPLLIVFLYTATFTVLFFTLPNPYDAQQLAFLPVALLAWYTGFPMGAVVGVLTLPFHTLLFNLLGAEGWNVALTGPGAINLVALFWIGCVIGGLRELRKQLARKIAQLEATRQHLSRSEARWRALFEAIPDSILRIGRNGTFLDFKASQDASVMMTPHFFLGKSIEEVLPAFAVEAARAIARALESGEVERFDYRLLVDGSERDYEAQIVAINDREVLSISRDITHRKRMEARLQSQLELETAIATVARTFLAQPDPDLSEILGLVAK
ncbi:MAG: PAS domain S-box protein, partial [Deltaproteobacteria bacterium]